MSRINFSSAGLRVTRTPLLSRMASGGALLLGLAFAASNVAAQAPPVKFGIAVYPGLFLELPVYVAEKTGIFSRNGIKSDIVLVSGGPNQAAAVASGDLDAFAFPSRLPCLLYTSPSPRD